MIWAERNDPSRHILIWNDGELRYSRERGRSLDDLLGLMQNTPAAIVGLSLRANDNDRPGSISAELSQRFGIKLAVGAPFHAAPCEGGVLMFNRAAWTAEEVALAEIVAHVLGRHIQELILRGQLERAIALRERERLGRDLHDGVLQGLAAAAMQLRALSASAPDPIRAELEAIRGIVGEEAQRIRAFVEEARVREKSTTGLVQVAEELVALVEATRRRWACGVTLTVTPPDLECSLSTLHSIRHMLSEAISNAVRHGRASLVEISISCHEEQIVLVIQDNGIGFFELDGIYSKEELKNGGVGPLSLRSRAEELGGALFLTSTPTGSNLTIELPR